MKDNNLFKRFVIIGILSWMIIFGIIPTIMLLGVSVLRQHPSDLIEFSFSLESYIRLFEPTLGSILMHSIFMAIIATGLCLLIGYPFAYVVARAERKHAQLMLLFIMIPFWTNSLIRTYSLVAVLKADGILNKSLMWIGIINEPLKIMFTETAVFIGLVYTLLPFMILPLYAAIEKLDQQMLEASRDLGATRWVTFKEITIPLTMPGIVSGCMLVFLPALGMFYIPDILGGARTMLLGNYIRDQFLASRDLPMGAAASVAMTLLMGLMLATYFKSIRKAGRKFKI